MSDIWKYFTKRNDGQRIECNMCESAFGPKSSTFTLWYHYNRSHKPAADCAGTSSSTLQTSIFQFGRSTIMSKSEDRYLDQMVAKFIWCDMKPFAVVEGRGFHDMIHAFSPGYKIKTPATYKVIIMKQYEIAKSHIKHMIKRQNMSILPQTCGHL